MEQSFWWKTKRDKREAKTWTQASLKIKKVCFSPKVPIQPLLKPFEHNLGQNSSITRLFQPTLGSKSALGNPVFWLAVRWATYALLTMALGRSRWLDIVLFWVFINRQEVEVNKNARPIPSHLEGTSFVNKDLFHYGPKGNFSGAFQDQREKFPACSTL